MDAWVQILVTVIGVLGSASIWKYLEARLKAKTEEKKADLENNDGVQYRDDLKDRVRNLESLLAQSADEKDELRNQVLMLTAEVHALRVKVEFLEKENDRLKNK
jgi:predicted nuclease with TOPRIM domain